MKKLEMQKLLHDQSGVSVTEFGLIAPAVITMLLGTMDVGHTLYMRTVIDGAIQEVARRSRAWRWWSCRSHCRPRCR